MDYIVDKVKFKIESLNKQQRYAFLSCLIAGFLAHGYALCNNYIYHDATILNGLGSTFGIGRWALGYMGVINDALLGNYHLPFFNIVVSLLFIAISAVITVDILCVKGNFLSIFIGAIFAVYPVVTSTFAYNFSAVFYFMALMLALLSVRQSLNNKYISGVILLTLSLGFYQAYFSVALTVSLTVVMVMLLDKDIELIDSIKKGVSFIASFIVSLLLYLVINKLSVIIMKPPATGYQGADDMGTLAIAKIPSRIIQSYLHFFYIKWNGINKATCMWVFIIAFLISAAVTILIHIYRKKLAIQNILFFALCVVIMPLAVNIVYVMSTDDNYSVHTLMRYATVFVLIMPALLMEKTSDEAVSFPVEKALNVFAALLLGTITLCYIYSNNVAYLKMNLVEEEMNSFFTVMQSRITGLDGYNDDMPVCFSGESKIVDNNLYDMNEMYEDTVILGYEYNARDLINRESWLRYMAYHTGFAPTVIDVPGDILESEEFKSMSAYPDDNSIKIINGIITVKLSE